MAIGLCFHCCLIHVLIILLNQMFVFVKLESNAFLNLIFLFMGFCPYFDLLQEQVFSENDAFFAWTFVKRRPLWQTLLSFFWPVLTLAICLFPVYPHGCKLLILYSCAGVLLLILSLLLCKFFSVIIPWILFDINMNWIIFLCV